MRGDPASQRKAQSEASKSNEWKSPLRVFEPLNSRYGFTLDAAAAPWNAQVPVYFTKRDNALARHWHGRVWLNPPYSRGNLARWMAKARGEVFAHRAELVCCLVPAYTCETWWQDHVESHAGALLEVSRADPDWGPTVIRRYRHLTISTSSVRGRLCFRERNGQSGSARFSSAVVVFERPVQTSAIRRSP